MGFAEGTSPPPVTELSLAPGGLCTGLADEQQAVLVSGKIFTRPYRRVLGPLEGIFLRASHHDSHKLVLEIITCRVNVWR